MIRHALPPCYVTPAKQQQRPSRRRVISWGTRRQQGDTFINGDDSKGTSASFPASTADILAWHRNTAHVAHASGWQISKYAIMQRAYSCKYCNYKNVLRDQSNCCRAPMQKHASIQVKKQQSILPRCGLFLNRLGPRQLPMCNTNYSKFKARTG